MGIIVDRFSRARRRPHRSGSAHGGLAEERASVSRVGEETVTGTWCWSPFGCFPEERTGETKDWVNASDCVWQIGDQVSAGHRPRCVSQAAGEAAAQELPPGRAPRPWRALVRWEECGRGIPQTYQAHLASPSAPRQPAPGHAESPGQPTRPQPERGSGWAGQMPYCGSGRGRRIGANF